MKLLGSSPSRMRLAPYLLPCRHLVPLLLIALAARPCPAQAPTGTIAYIRDRSEIRTISPDGSNDRLLWKHPNPKLTNGLFGVSALAWSPDGQELAFTSGHELACSFYESDVYVMRADGSRLRRITNPPSYAAAQALPHGKVVVTIQNDRLRGYASGLFIVSIAGADKAQTMTVPPGEARSTTFDHVADFGSHPQPIIALNGMYRWISPGIDVFAGQTVKAPPLVIMGSGFRGFGAYGPVWRPDGKEIGYTLGSSIGVYSISTSAGPGAGPGREVAGTSKPGAGAFDWGPANADGGPILYTGTVLKRDNSVYQASVDGSQRRKCVSTGDESNYMLDVHWLPDGSGFLYVQNSSTEKNSNLFLHDLTTGRNIQVTRLRGKHLKGFDLSPDCRWIVYAQTTELWPPVFGKDTPDVWVVRIDGTGPRLLVQNATAPSWKQ